MRPWNKYTPWAGRLASVALILLVSVGAFTYGFLAERWALQSFEEECTAEHGAEICSETLRLEKGQCSSSSKVKGFRSREKVGTKRLVYCLRSRAELRAKKAARAGVE